tara:strand:+ start:3357 stop:3461 length:105 start_codon:yes stop_codon:yes gene_type:complete
LLYGGKLYEDRIPDKNKVKNVKNLLFKISANLKI